MAENNKMEIVKATANLWVDLLDEKNSECSITSFDHSFYLNQDFTNNKGKLKVAINSLQPMFGTNYDAAFLGPKFGSIGVAAKGKYKRVVIFLTDGQPNNEPKVDEIISEALKNNVKIFSILVDIPSSQSVYDISNTTGGKVFEKISNEKELFDTFVLISSITHRTVFCDIEWLSAQQCLSTSTIFEIKYLPLQISRKSNYTIPYKGIAFLKPSPLLLRIGIKPIGVSFDTNFFITAVNRMFVVTDIISTNPDFEVNPKQFSLEDGETIQINVRYTPKDTSYSFTSLTFVNDFCPLQYFIIAGKYGGRKQKNLEVVHPNGREIFGLGSDTVVRWRNISPADTVVIEYSTNSGNDWRVLTDTASGLSWVWKNIPPPKSDNCLIRITRKEERDTLIERYSLDWSLRYNSDVFNWHPSYEYIAYSDANRVRVVDRQF
ncbi:MAG: VWA domain-containing protein [Ignavibacteria bacterium]|nr:VWA domain-containing protein [Ignavibacteria bacterium]